MKIQVTAEDIKNGNRNSCYTCPIALAIRRSRGRISAVTPSLIYIDGLYSGAIATPDVVRDFIALFDAFYRMEQPQPFSFELPEVPA